MMVLNEVLAGRFTGQQAAKVLGLRRRYMKEFKLEAVRQIEETGRPVRDIALDLGVRHDYQALLSKHKALPSISWTGNAYDNDNAPMESLLATLKTKLVHHCRFHTREQAQAALFDYMEIFYNRQRIHWDLSYRIPTDFKALYRAA